MSGRLMHATHTTAPPRVEEALTFFTPAPLVLAIVCTASSENVVATFRVIMPTTNLASAFHRSSIERHALALTAPLPVGLAITAGRDYIVETARQIVTASGRAAAVSIAGKSKPLTL